MPLRFGFTVRVPDTPLTQPQQAAAVAEAVFRPAVEDATLLAEREVKGNAPVGATAVLRGSVQSDVEALRGTSVQFRGEVVVGAPYGPAVDAGTRPHWAPIRPLKLWAKRVLGDERAAYAIQHVIAERGTKATHFWRDSVAAVRPRMARILRDAGTAFARRLRGD